MSKTEPSKISKIGTSLAEIARQLDESEPREKRPKRRFTQQDIAGRKWGRLQPLYRCEPGRGAYWVCQCDCGNICEVARHNFMREERPQVSCGCLRNEHLAAGGSQLTHGMSDTDIYRRWHGLHRHKGGVAQDWLTSFERFYADVGEPPFPRAIIMRKDESRELGPDNFKWGTARERMSEGTTERMRLFTLNGVTKSCAAWARDLGITRECLRRRIDISKWPLEKALSTPKMESDHMRGVCGVTRRPPKYFATFDGVTKSVAQWARDFGLSYPTMRRYVERPTDLTRQRLEALLAHAKGQQTKEWIPHVAS